MKKILIFVCALIAVGLNSCSHEVLSISDANPIQLYLTGVQTFNQKNVWSVKQVCYLQKFNCSDHIRNQLYDTDATKNYDLVIKDDAGNTVLFQPFTRKVVTIGAIYDYSFVPSDAGFCNDQYQFIIRDHADNSVKAQSDAVHIKTSHEGTLLITYSNSNTFAGLDYSDETPAIIFYLRLHAILIQESYPEESESIDLSNNQTVQLVSELKRKKNLFIEPEPDYMHRKTQLVLAHDSVYIDGDYWMKQDGYTIAQGNKRWPLRQATCLLTDKYFYQRNVL